MVEKIMNDGIRRKALWTLIGVFALLGFWRIGVSVFSQIDDGLMWFDSEGELGKAREDIRVPLEQMHLVCQQLLAHDKLKLDDRTLGRFETLCSRLERASSTRAVHHILQYMAYHKSFFSDLMIRLEGQLSLDVAALGMEMQVLECNFIGTAENIKSISSSARVSDFLLGFIFLIVGGIGALRMRRTPGRGDKA